MYAYLFLTFSSALYNFKLFYNKKIVLSNVFLAQYKTSGYRFNGKRSHFVSRFPQRYTAASSPELRGTDISGVDGASQVLRRQDRAYRLKSRQRTGKCPPCVSRSKFTRRNVRTGKCLYQDWVLPAPQSPMLSLYTVIPCVNDAAPAYSHTNSQWKMLAVVHGYGPHQVQTRFKQIIVKEVNCGEGHFIYLFINHTVRQVNKK